MNACVAARIAARAASRRSRPPLLRSRPRSRQITEHRRRAMESGWKPVESVSGTSGVALCHGLAIVGIRRNEGGFGDSLNIGRHERGSFENPKAARDAVLHEAALQLR